MTAVLTVATRPATADADRRAGLTDGYRARVRFPIPLGLHGARNAHVNCCTSSAGAAVRRRRRTTCPPTYRRTTGGPLRIRLSRPSRPRKSPPVESALLGSAATPHQTGRLRTAAPSHDRRDPVAVTFIKRPRLRFIVHPLMRPTSHAADGGKRVGMTTTSRFTPHPAPVPTTRGRDMTWGL